MTQICNVDGRIDLLRDRSAKFPPIEQREQVQCLRIWHCKYKTLQPIAELQNLEELVIATFPDQTFQILASLRKLRYLRVLHMPKITSLQGLAELTGLESLALETSPSWDGKRWTTVDSLEPIAAIPNLKHLQLFGVCPPDRSLIALEKLKSLQSARFSQYPQAEIDRFYHATGAANEYMPKSSFT